MNEEERERWGLIVVSLLWAGMMAAYMWTGSWHKVFIGIGMIIGAFFAAGFIYFICSFVYEVGNEFCLAGKWLEKLDKRLDEIEEQVRSNDRQIGHWYRANLDIEEAILGLRETMKKDSKEMAKGSVKDAAEQILSG